LNHDKKVRQSTALIEIAAVGILTAAAAHLLSHSVGWLGALRLQLSQSEHRVR
jgi:hypothetical protein